MKVRWGEAAGAFLTLLMFVALPLAALRYLSPQILSQLEESGLSIQGVVNQIMILGIIIAAITVAKAVIVQTSVTYLLLDIISIVIGLAFALLIFGAGNISSFGCSNLRLGKGEQTIDLTLDLRVFIYITLVTVALRILQSILKFREARIEVNPEA